MAAVLVLLAATVALLAPGAAAGQCYRPIGGLPFESASPDGDSVCKWYSGDSCCLALHKDTLRGVEFGGQGCRSRGSRCKEKLELLECAQCAPDTAAFAVETGLEDVSFRVCENFGNELYDACQKADYLDNDGECVQVRDAFEEPSAFVDSLVGFVSHEGNLDCFSAAGWAAPVRGLVLAAAVLVGAMII